MKVMNPLLEKQPKQFGIGGALPPKKDVHMFVRWPPVVQIQRKRRILMQRLKVPPALKQFTKTLDKNLGISFVVCIAFFIIICGLLCIILRV
ncbi:putative ribosomal protein L7A/L8 [Helianthus debilis subsp. tardiflorus]